MWCSTTPPRATSTGPRISYRGIDNKTYYMLDGKGGYLNFSGTGQHPGLQQPHCAQPRAGLLCRYWVSEYHIDGFRFDLASILGSGLQQRRAPGEPSRCMEALAYDPILSRLPS